MNPWATIGILVTMAEPAQQQSIGVILDSITDGVFSHGIGRRQSRHILGGNISIHV